MKLAIFSLKKSWGGYRRTTQQRHLLPPLPDFWHTSFFFLPGPGPLMRVQRFRAVHWAVQTRFRSYLSFQPPVYLSKCPSSFTFLLSVSPSLASILCAPQNSLWTVFLLGFLLGHSVLFRLRYPTFFQRGLLLHSSIQQYQYS